MREGFWGIGNGLIVFLLMKLNSFESTGREGYTAPKCRVFSFCVEGSIALGSPEPGEPSSPDSYNDYEDD